MKMKIIGEKINGTRKRVARAIAEKDSQFIRELATKQTEAGADWLDANAGTKPEKEPEDLIWLVEQIQAAVDTPICLDSANPAALARAMEVVERTPMINSISGEPERLEGVLPLAADKKCQVIALAMDEKGIPKKSNDRIAIIERLMATTRKAGIPDADVYVDPLVLTIATDTESGRIFFDTVRSVRKTFPEVHFTSGLSNISFGLPVRSLINRAFLTLAVEAGLDSAILDPNDRDLMSAIYAAELVSGKDRHCLNYTRAFRAGAIG